MQFKKYYYLTYNFQCHQRFMGIRHENGFTNAVLRIRSIFFRSASGPADPVLKIRIRIRILLDMFLMFNIIHYFLWHFLTTFKHLMATYNQRYKFCLQKLYFGQYYITKKIELQGSVCRLRIRIRLTQKDRIRIRNTGFQYRNSAVILLKLCSYLHSLHQIHSSSGTFKLCGQFSEDLLDKFGPQEVTLLSVRVKKIKQRQAVTKFT